MFDWQVIAVTGLLLLACAYIGRRAWLRLSSFGASRRMNASSCAEGCGACTPNHEGTPSISTISRNPQRP